MTRIALDDPESQSIRTAAAIVQEVLNRRPAGFQNLIHGENSTELKALLNDLGETTIHKALDEAGLTKWVKALAQAQKEFQAVEDRQNARQRTEKKPRTLAEIRRDFNETLRAILGNLAWVPTTSVRRANTRFVSAACATNSPDCRPWRNAETRCARRRRRRNWRRKVRIGGARHRPGGTSRW